MWAAVRTLCFGLAPTYNKRHDIAFLGAPLPRCFAVLGKHVSFRACNYKMLPAFLPANLPASSSNLWMLDIATTSTAEILNKFHIMAAAQKTSKVPLPLPPKKTWGPHPDEGPELLSEFWSAGALPTFSHFSFWTLRSKPWRGTWSASQKDKASILHLWNLGTCTAPDEHDVNSTERLAPDGQLSVESHGTPPAESTAQLQSWHRCHSHDITRLGQLMSVGQREHSLLSKEEQSTTSSLWNVPELKLLLWISLWFLNTRHAMGQGLISSYFHVLHGSICISYFCHHACPLAKPVWLTWMHFGWSNTIVGLRHLSFPQAQWVSKVRWWSNPSNQAKLTSATHLSGCVKLLQFRPPLRSLSKSV